MRFFGRARRDDNVTNSRKIADALQKKESEKDQLNLWVLKGIKTIARILAAQYDVPIGAVCGHCLEVGMVYLAPAYNDPEEEERVKHHLIDRHISGKSDTTSMVHHMVTSAPVLASLLSQDVKELDQAIKRLDHLGFVDNKLSDKDWHK